MSPFQLHATAPWHFFTAFFPCHTCFTPLFRCPAKDSERCSCPIGAPCRLFNSLSIAFSAPRASRTAFPQPDGVQDVFKASFGASFRRAISTLRCNSADTAARNSKHQYRPPSAPPGRACSPTTIRRGPFSSEPFSYAF